MTRHARPRMTRTSRPWRAYSVRVRRVPGPGADPADPWTVLQLWAVGLISGSLLYGLGVRSAVLPLIAYCVLGSTRRGRHGRLRCFVGSAIAFILPAHIVIALSGVVGCRSAVVRSGSRGRWSRSVVCRPSRQSGDVLAVSARDRAPRDRRVGRADGPRSAAAMRHEPQRSHHLARSTRQWRETVASSPGAGMLLAIPVAWVVADQWNVRGCADIYVGTHDARAGRGDRLGRASRRFQRCSTSFFARNRRLRDAS